MKKKYRDLQARLRNLCEGFLIDQNKEENIGKFLRGVAFNFADENDVDKEYQDD